MTRSRCFFALALICGLGPAVAGCEDDPAPAPTAAPDTSAVVAAPASAGAAPAAANRLGSLSKLDPHVMKAYRIDVCYFGTISLKTARDAYLASLGGAEPGAGKVPSFGGGEDDAKDAKKPVDPKAAKAARAADADTKDPKDLKRKALENRRKAAMRAPHERNARSCSVAAGLKNPAAPDVDAALKEFAPFAVQLAKDLTAAQVYYQRGQHDEDQFAKGKEFHKTLLAEFEKLDALHDKLGAAIEAWHTATPPPVDEDPPDAEPEAEQDAQLAKLNKEGRRIGNAAFAASRLVMLELAKKEPDGAKIKEMLPKITEETEALKKFGEEHKDNTWPKIMVPTLESFVEEVTAATDGSKLKDPTTQIILVNMTTRLIEARHRALTRALLSKARGLDASKLRPQIMPPGHPGMPGRPGAMSPRDALRQKQDAPEPPPAE